MFNSIPDGEPSGGLMEMGGDGAAEPPSIPAVLVSQVRKCNFERTYHFEAATRVQDYILAHLCREARPMSAAP